MAIQSVEPAAPLDGSATMLVDAATLPAGFAAPAEWKAALEQGATIIVHGASPEQKPLLANLAGRPVEIKIHPYSMWEGRGCRNGFTWLTPGMSHVDLYWKEYDGWEGAGFQAEVAKYKIADLNYWSVSAERRDRTRLSRRAGGDSRRQGPVDRGPDEMGSN